MGRVVINCSFNPQISKQGIDREEIQTHVVLLRNEYVGKKIKLNLKR
jgi:hypothetical protein